MEMRASVPIKNQRFSHFHHESSPVRKTKAKSKEIDVFSSNETIKKKRFFVLTSILESKLTQIIITLFTIYALFADDMRIACTSKNTDYVFDGFTITCFIIFFLEIILSIIVKENYIFSFFFWLDLISTISLIIDITTINEQILYKKHIINIY